MKQRSGHWADQNPISAEAEALRDDDELSVALVPFVVVSGTLMGVAILSAIIWVIF